jgi:hypothetical protein
MVHDVAEHPGDALDGPRVAVRQHHVGQVEAVDPQAGRR